MTAQVIDYLVNQCGWKKSAAERVVAKHKAVVDKCASDRSFPYWIADRVIEAECASLGVFEIPSDYINPNWTEPDEDEESDEE